MASPARRNRVRQAIANARPVGGTVGIGNAKPLTKKPGLGGGGSPVTPPTPSQPANPAAGSPAPWETDPLYVEGAGAALQSRKNALGYLRSGWNAKEDYYGFGSHANPYSQAELLSREHRNARKGAVNSAGFGLYSGSTVNHLRGADRTYDFNVKELERRHSAEEAEVKRKEQEASEEYDQALGSLKSEALGRLIETEPEPAPLPSGPAPAAGGSKKGKKGNKGKGKK